MGLVLACGAVILVALGSRGPLPFTVFAAGALALALGIARVVREEGARRADLRLVRPVPAPSDERLAEMIEPVFACPECGATDVMAAVAGHDGNMIECPRCTYIGGARLFSRREDYANYVHRLPR